ncbi:MAG: PaaI family thioesterase [Parvularculaceae bacterium]
MTDEANHKDVNPAISAMLRTARDFLTHEHSLFRSLSLEPILIGKGKATFSMELPQQFADGEGFVHGGLSTIILDSIFGLTVFTALEELKPIATVNLRTDYISRARFGVRAVCSAECDGVRNDIAYVTGRLALQADNSLLATGAGAFMVGTRGPIKGLRV